MSPKTFLDLSSFTYLAEVSSSPTLLLVPHTLICRCLFPPLILHMHDTATWHFMYVFTARRHMWSNMAWKTSLQLRFQNFASQNFNLYFYFDHCFRCRDGRLLWRLLRLLVPRFNTHQISGHSSSSTGRLYAKLWASCPGTSQFRAALRPRPVELELVPPGTGTAISGRVSLPRHTLTAHGCHLKNFCAGLSSPQPFAASLVPLCNRNSC